ncbi:MAG: hypothetical protein QOD33_1434 [Pyrinomonadaceae bacterium]|jgi:hypothetical protein|nr:hypothetical protein [Pyrinomonadaceae bacterium]
MVMVTKEVIKSEIERVPEERLAELLEVVKIFSRTETESNGDTLFSKLRKISIEGPEDFSENLDLYLSGEKTIG